MEVIYQLLLAAFVFMHIGCTVPAIVDQRKSKSFEGDIEMSRKEMNKIQSEILFTGKVYSIYVWKDGKIPYVISPKFDSSQKEIISEALREISGDTCIQFIPRTNEVDYIDFVKSDSRCNSKVGRVGKRQEILMSPTCMRHGTVVHELLHTLGLYHEQSRPDRDKFVTIQWDNLKTADSKRNFEKYRTKFQSIYDLPYDYASIMHYSSEAFSKQYGKKTIVPKAPNTPIGQRSSMSYFDKVKINMLYECPFE